MNKQRYLGKKFLIAVGVLGVIFITVLYALKSNWKGLETISKRVTYNKAAAILANNMVCNGTTDDSNTLQTLLNSGAVTVIPEGTCRITKDIIVPIDRTIRGQGKMVSTLLFENGGLIAPFGSDRLHLEQLRIRITKSSQIGLRISGSWEHVLRDVVFSSTKPQTGTGMRSWDEGDRGVYSVNLDDVQFENLEYGLILGRGGDKAGSNVWTLTGLKFVNNKVGLWIAYATAIEVLGGWFEANKEAAIEATEGQNNVCQKINILGAYFENPDYQVIIPWNCRDWTFDSATMVGNKILNKGSNISWWNTP